jgi:hypothetical protein
MNTSTPCQVIETRGLLGEGEGKKKEGRGGAFVASSFSQQLSLRVVGWARTSYAASGFLWFTRSKEWAYEGCCSPGIGRLSSSLSRQYQTKRGPGFDQIPPFSTVTFLTTAYFRHLEWSGGPV